MLSVEERALAGVRFSRRSVIAGDRPPRYGPRTVFSLRRARACPSPCYRLGKGPWSAFVFRAGRAIAGDRPPRYGPRTVFLSVGRGPVPRRAIGHTCAHPLCRARVPALDPFGSRCSRTTVMGHASPRGGQAPALRYPCGFSGFLFSDFPFPLH